MAELRRAILEIIAGRDCQIIDTAHDVTDKVLAVLHAQEHRGEDGAGWRDMDSAPLTGGSVLLWVEGLPGYVCEAHYEAEHDGWWLANTDQTDYHDGQVRNPAKWQPLPAPPGAGRNVGQQIVSDLEAIANDATGGPRDGVAADVQRDNDMWARGLRDAARIIHTHLCRADSPSPVPQVQTITISSRDGVWFATSEDEPSIFVSAGSREAVNAGLAHALHPPPEGATIPAASQFESVRERCRQAVWDAGGDNAEFHCAAIEALQEDAG